MDEELLSLYIKNWDDVATTSLKTLSDLLDANLKIQRVRELHKRQVNSLPNSEVCAACYDNYPCPTIQALDGEQ
jgi:hypothetical protein